MPTLQLNSALLLAAVKQASALVVPNAVVPIVENVLLDIEHGGVLTVHSTNLETNLAVRVLLADKTAKPFRICLPAKLLLSTLASLPSQAITLEVYPDTYATTIRAGNGRYQFAGENQVDWPQPQVSKPRQRVSMPAAALAAALLSTGPFVTIDQLRPELCAVLLSLRDGGLCRSVGCDGHRMAWHTFSVVAVDQVKMPYVPGNYLLPSGAAKILAGLCQKAGPDEPITLELGEWLRAAPESDAWQLEARLVDSRYPDYENIIPIHNPNQLSVEKADIKAIIRRVTGFANETTYQIRLTMPAVDGAGVVTISAEDLDFSHEAQDELPADYHGEPSLQIGFNAKFLDTCLSVMPEGPVHIEMSTPARAGLFRTGGQQPNTPGFTEFLLMPVILNNYV